MEVEFLSQDIVYDLHDFAIKKYGGINGVIKGKSISSALDRIHWHILYGDLKQDNVLHIAAKYTVAISQGHIFIDGNKRTAFLSMKTFLEKIR